MKRFLSILLIFFLFGSGCAPKADHIDGFAVVYDDHSFYLIDREGNLFSLSAYDEIVGEMGPYLIVKKGHRFGYIRNTGEEITPMIYDMAMPFSEGLAVVKTNNSFHTINTLGETVFSFEEGISSYSRFSDGLLVVEQNGRFGYMDTNGTVVIEPIYDDAHPFSEGKAAVGHLLNGELVYAFIETNGSPLTPYEFRSVGTYKNGFVPVAKEKNAQGNYLYGYLNEFGSLAIPYSYETAMNFHEGLAVIGNYISKIGGRVTYTFMDYRYIDTTGTIVLDPNQAFVGIFYGNFYPGTFENDVSRFFFHSWGVYDKTMEQIVKPSYMEMSDFKNGYAVVRKYFDQYGIIDADGNIVVEIKYRKVLY